LRFVGGSVDKNDSEVYRAKWFSTSYALQILTYVKEKRILKKAMAMLGKTGDF
jgi:hypothetical protein